MKPKAKLIAFALLLLVSACTSPPTGPTQSIDNNQNTGGAGQTNGEPFLPMSGIASIDLLTPPSGAGSKPHFEWSAIEGALQYTLFLQFTDGQPYWSWTGSGTSIYLGGSDSPPPEDAAGPVLLDGMSWAVIALDAEGNVIASSNLQQISP